MSTINLKSLSPSNKKFSKKNFNGMGGTPTNKFKRDTKKIAKTKITLKTNAKENDELVKNHVFNIVNELQVEFNKNTALKEEYKELADIFFLLFKFCQQLIKILSELLRISDPNLFHELYKKFLDIKSKIPKKLSLMYEEDLKVDYYFFIHYDEYFFKNLFLKFFINLE